MKSTFFVFLFLLWVCKGFAQSPEPEVVATSGNSFLTGSVQLDWTLGELSVTTISGSNQQITQGFHQPEYRITSITELPSDFWEVQIFPNPTTDRIQIKLELEQDRKVFIRMTDSTGKLVWTKETEGQTVEESAEMNAFPAGSYFLSFQIGEKQFSSVYKILKIK